MAYDYLSPKAAAAKKKRDLAEAKTPRRSKMKAENQRKRRAAKKAGKNINNKDYDHSRGGFVSVSTNRSGTKSGNNTKNTPMAKGKFDPKKKAQGPKSNPNAKRPTSGPYSKAAQEKRKAGKSGPMKKNHMQHVQAAANTLMTGSPMKRWGALDSMPSTPMKRCHSSDAACLKAERLARREKNTAAYMARGGKTQEEGGATFTKGASAKAPMQRKKKSAKASDKAKKKQAKREWESYDREVKKSSKTPMKKKGKDPHKSSKKQARLQKKDSAKRASKGKASASYYSLGLTDKK